MGIGTEDGSTKIINTRYLFISSYINLSYLDILKWIVEFKSIIQQLRVLILLMIQEHWLQFAVIIHSISWPMLDLKVHSPKLVKCGLLQCLSFTFWCSFMKKLALFGSNFVKKLSELWCIIDKNFFFLFEEKNLLKFFINQNHKKRKMSYFFLIINYFFQLLFTVIYQRDR